MTETSETVLAYGTKASTLAALQPLLPPWVEIPPFAFFSIAEWRADPDRVISQVWASLSGCRRVAVRSSSRLEDQDFTHAGEFLSLLNIRLLDHDAFVSAVEQVVAVMTSHPRSTDDDQVLVQSFVADVDIAGAATSHDLESGAPYAVISSAFDTVGVTSGSANVVDEVAIRHSAHWSVVPRNLWGVVGLLRALGDLGLWPCEVEFVVTSEDSLLLLQARKVRVPIVAPATAALEYRRALDVIKKTLGSDASSVLSDMTDWNPAEMIGQRPTPLSYSLYSRLITDATWSVARATQGYHGPDGPLMLQVGPRPMIDVRKSLESFVPAAVPAGTRLAIAETCLEKLRRVPSLHRSVEFDVAVPSFYLGAGPVIDERFAHVLDEQERAVFKSALRDVTASILIEAQAADRLRILEAEVTGFCSLDVEALLRILADSSAGRSSGALTFALLARTAFVAESVLRSLETSGVLEPGRVAALRQCVRSPASRLAEAAEELWVEAFGHLRPGTYDIRNSSFAESGYAPAQVASTAIRQSFRLADDETSRLLEHADVQALGLDANLPEVLISAIEAREMGKFHYAKSVSHILTGLISWGRTNGISRDDLAFLTIADLTRDLGSQELRTMAASNRKTYADRCTVVIPSVIREAKDLEIASFGIDDPTFVTRVRAEGRVVTIPAATAPFGVDVSQAIVLTENADPGFDWIFAAGAAALVTCYGGANSHMTVRCHELGVPAAIGCGPALYERLRRAARLAVDGALGTLSELT